MSMLFAAMCRIFKILVKFQIGLSVMSGLCYTIKSVYDFEEKLYVGKHMASFVALIFQFEGK